MMRWFLAPLLITIGTSTALAQPAQAPVRAIRGHFELVPLLTTALKAPDSAVRARCVFLLGQIGSRRSATALAPLLSDPSRAVRYQAGIALCNLGDARGLAATGAALASAAEWIRYYAVHALAGLASEDARRTLASLRQGQPELITEQTDEALKTWPWPSVPPEKATRALGPYRNLTDLFIDAGGVFVVESDVYWHQGVYPQCVRCNETTTFLDPAYVDVYSNSAWLLWSMGQHDRSISVVAQGVSANPKSWEAWYNLGYQHVLMHEYARAVRPLKRSVALGAPAINYHQYCHALEKSGHPELALKEWQVLLKAFPGDVIAPRQIARLQKVLRGEEPPQSNGTGGESARLPAHAC